MSTRFYHILRNVHTWFTKNWYLFKRWITRNKVHCETCCYASEILEFSGGGIKFNNKVIVGAADQLACTCDNYKESRIVRPWHPACFFYISWASYRNEHE